MRERRSIALRFLAATGTVAGVLAVGAPAAPATSTSSGGGSSAPAKAATTFTWKSATRIEPLYLRVEDNKCDGLGVYAFFRVYWAPGSYWKSQLRRHTGCNGYTNFNSYINDNRAIYAVKLYACVDTASADPCWVSDMIYNPHVNYPTVDTDLPGVTAPEFDQLILGADGVVASGG